MQDVELLDFADSQHGRLRIGLALGGTAKRGTDTRPTAATEWRADTVMELPSR